MNLPAPLSHLVSENALKKQQEEKMASKISEIHLHQKVDETKEKVIQHFIRPPKFNPLLFSNLQAFHK